MLKKGLPFVFLTALLFNFCLANNFNKDSLMMTIDSMVESPEKVQEYLKASKKAYNSSQRNQSEDEFLSKGLELAIRIKDSIGMRECMYIHGWRYRNKGEYGDALRYLNRSLEISRALNDTSYVIKNLNSIGVTYRRLDENQKAVEYNLEALKLAEANNDQRSISISLNSLGNVYTALGDFEKAEENLLRALDLSKDGFNKRGVSINMNNLGRIYERTGRYDKALNYYSQALKLDEESNNQIGIAISYNSIGDVYFLKGEYQNALDWYQKALELNLTLGDKRYIDISYVDLGRAYSKLNNDEKAIEYLEKGLALAKEIGSKNQAKLALEFLSDHYTDRKAFEKALSYSQLATVYGDSLSKENMEREIARMQTVYESEQKDNTIRLLTQEQELQETRHQRKQTLWIAIAGFLLLSGILTYVVAQQRRLKAERKMHELEKQILQAQMNPHFLFNSLNSIKSFIIKNQATEASDYLNKFSRLVRYTLDNSGNQWITLDREFKFLSDYIELEKHRLNNKFNCEMHLDDELNATEVMIPPLLIQPFVENAIWHGLSHKETNGLLSMSFKQQKDQLVIQIDDNGIGRKKSSEINNRKKESKGIGLTQQRIKGISNDARCEIIDLVSDDDTASGTRVIVRLPLVIR